MGNKGNLNDFFPELYETYFDELKKYSLQLVNWDDYLAEEMVQQAYTKLYIASRELECFYVDNPRAYLKVSITHAIQNYYRDNARFVYMDDYDAWDRLELGAVSAEDEYMEYITVVKYHHALLHMKAHNEKWYYIVKEVFLKKRSQVEVAKELGVSRGGMYSSIFKLRQWSKKHIGDLQYEWQ